MKILKIQDIVERYQVTYYQARKWLNTRSCPVLPRSRGGKYRVLQDEFDKWLKNSKAIWEGMKNEKRLQSIWKRAGMQR